MRIGVLGTGVVGQPIASELVELGHEVKMGSRAAGNEKSVAWAQDAGAKAEVASLLESFGWFPPRIVALGGIEASRGTEMHVALWLRLMGALGTPQFNIGVAR